MADRWAWRTPQAISDHAAVEDNETYDAIRDLFEGRWPESAVGPEDTVVPEDDPVLRDEYLVAQYGLFRFESFQPAVAWGDQTVVEDLGPSGRRPHIWCTRVNKYVIYHRPLTEDELGWLKRRPPPAGHLADHYIYQITSVARYLRRAAREAA